MQRSVRIVAHIIDDDAALRGLIVALLQAANIAAESYSSPLEFLKKLPDVAPGCIVTDVRMPEMDGLAFQQKLIELGIKLPVIVVTGHANVAMSIKAMKKGAFDFIEKPFDHRALVATVRAALESSERQEQIATRVAEIKAKMNSLTERERQVMDAIMTGASNKIIARELGMSSRTAEVHRARIMTKMQAGSLAELIRMVLLIRP